MRPRPRGDGTAGRWMAWAHWPQMTSPTQLRLFPPAAPAAKGIAAWFE